MKPIVEQLELARTRTEEELLEYINNQYLDVNVVKKFIEDNVDILYIKSINL